jgi:hypothetical protein
MGDRWIARADQLDGIDLSPAQILDPHWQTLLFTDISTFKTCNLMRKNCDVNPSTRTQRGACLGSCLVFQPPQHHNISSKFRHTDIEYKAAWIHRCCNCFKRRIQSPRPQTLHCEAQLDRVYSTSSNERHQDKKIIILCNRSDARPGI